MQSLSELIDETPPDRLRDNASPDAQRMRASATTEEAPPTAPPRRIAPSTQDALEAAEHGDARALAAYLENGGDPAATSRLHHMGWSLLHLAAGALWRAGRARRRRIGGGPSPTRHGGFARCVELLLAAGAEPAPGDERPAPLAGAWSTFGELPRARAAARARGPPPQRRSRRRPAAHGRRARGHARAARRAARLAAVAAERGGEALRVRRGGRARAGRGGPLAAAAARAGRRGSSGTSPRARRRRRRRGRRRGPSSSLRRGRARAERRRPARAPPRRDFARTSASTAAWRCAGTSTCRRRPARRRSSTASRPRRRIGSPLCVCAVDGLSSASPLHHYGRAPWRCPPSQPVWKSNFRRPAGCCPCHCVCAMAWSFARHLDGVAHVNASARWRGNLARWLLSTQVDEENWQTGELLAEVLTHGLGAGGRRRGPATSRARVASGADTRRWTRAGRRRRRSCGLSKRGPRTMRNVFNQRFRPCLLASSLLMSSERKITQKKKTTLMKRMPAIPEARSPDSMLVASNKHEPVLEDRRREVPLARGDAAAQPPRPRARRRRKIPTP